MECGLSFCFIKELFSSVSELVSLADLTLFSSLSEAFDTATVLAIDEERVFDFLLYRASLEGNSWISPSTQGRSNGKVHYKGKKHVKNT